MHTTLPNRWHHKQEPQQEESNGQQLIKSPTERQPQTQQWNGASTAAGGIPLLLLFLVQLLVVAGSFGGLCSMFVLQHRRQLDKDVDAIERATLHGGCVALSLPIEHHAYVTRQLQLHIQATQTMIPILPDPTASTEGDDNASSSNSASPLFELSDYYYLFPMMRVPLIKFDALRWAYQLRNTHRYNRTFSNNSIWYEAGCAGSHCYYCFATGCYAAVGDINNPAQYGLLPSDYKTFTEVYVDLPPTPEGRVVVKTARLISQELRHQWSGVYRYTNPSGQSELLLSLLRCLTFDPDSNECVHAVGADLHIAYFTEVVHRLSTPGSTVAIVDMRTMLVIASTGSGIDEHNWATVQQGPSHLRGALAQYLAACPHNDLHESNFSYHHDPLTDSCLTSVATIDDHIVGIGRVLPFDCWQVDFLLVHMTPAAHYYAEPERATLVAISVVVAVTLVCIATGVVVYASISWPLAKMARNFLLAAALRNDEVVPSDSVIAEVRQLCGQFDAMNQCLTLARAFLPQSLLEAAKDSPFTEESNPITIRETTCAVPIMVSSSASDVSEDVPAARVAPVHGGDADHGGCSWRRCSETASTSSSYKPLESNPLAAQRETISPATSSRRLNGRTVVHFDDNVVDQHRVAVPIRSQLWQRVSSTGLTTRPVAVVFGNIVGFHNLCEAHGAQHAFNVARIVVGVIQAELAPRRGVLEQLHGDRVMITFNASSDCSAAPKACAAFLQQVLEALTQQHATIEGHPFAGMRFGAASGLAVCGYVGTRSLQRHSAVGPVVHYAWKLMERAKAVDRMVVMDALVTDGASPADGFVTEAVDLVSFYRGAMLSIHETVALQRISGAAPPLVAVRSMVPSAHITGPQHRVDLAHINSAFHHLVHGRIDAATEHIKDGLARMSDAYNNVAHVLDDYVSSAASYHSGIDLLHDDETLLDALVVEEARRGSKS